MIDDRTGYFLGDGFLEEKPIRGPAVLRSEFTLSIRVIMKYNSGCLNGSCFHEHGYSPLLPKTRHLLAFAEEEQDASRLWYQEVFWLTWKSGEVKSLMGREIAGGRFSVRQCTSNMERRWGLSVLT